MRFVLVEDDPLQAEWILGVIANAFKNAELTLVSTASRFISEMPVLERRVPSVIIVDEMLRWADTPTIEDVESGLVELSPPPDWRPTRAGVELIRQIRSSEALSEVPTILYTVLEERDLTELSLPDTVQHVTKNIDPSVLIAAVRKAVRNQR